MTLNLKHTLLLIMILLSTIKGYTQTKTIHVFVALCDNEYQGIVPVPEELGNGQKPHQNLYWGALYGVKTFLKYKTKDWTYIKTLPSTNPFILDRILFKHASKDTYLLAEAYDGEHIKPCTEDFLKAANAQNPFNINIDDVDLNFGGGADLIAYAGHDGLMDFNVEVNYKDNPNKAKDIMILACYSQEYFTTELKLAKANPILWTTHLMAPEAYTLKAAIDGWINMETPKEIEERAAQVYHQYQKCGLKGARNLFTTGFKN